MVRFPVVRRILIALVTVACTLTATACAGIMVALNAVGSSLTRIVIGALCAALLLVCPPLGWVSIFAAGALGAVGAILSTPASPPPSGDWHHLPQLPLGIPWKTAAVLGLAFLAYHRRRPLADALRAARGGDARTTTLALLAALFGSRVSPPPSPLKEPSP